MFTLVPGKDINRTNTTGGTEYFGAERVSRTDTILIATVPQVTK